MWCKRAFHRDFEGRPTLNESEAVSSDLLGKLRAECCLEDYITHTIGMAEFLGLKGPSTYVESFMYLVRFIDGDGDQQWAWMRYFTPANEPQSHLQKDHG